MPRGGSARDVGFAPGGQGSLNGIAGLGMMGKGEGPGGASAFKYFFDNQGNVNAGLPTSGLASERGNTRYTPRNAQQDRFGNPIISSANQAKIDEAKRLAEHTRRMREDPVYQQKEMDRLRAERIAGYESGVNSAFSIFDDDFYSSYGDQYGQGYTEDYANQFTGAKQRIEDRFAPLGALGETHIADAFRGLEDFYSGLGDDISGDVDSFLDTYRRKVDSSKDQFLASARQDKGSAVTDAQARVAELKAPAKAPSAEGAFDSFFAKNPFLIGGTSSSGGTAAQPATAGAGSRNKSLLTVGSSGNSSTIVK